ncbi:histidine phosphatase family protein [Thiomicrorhabdus aquaedulcis]|uniref:histidine phosphatase family protein n=1 Tax=Thiomicrorhabdus aquaedulcis TaxID=2211106 RepID=UPI000FDAAB6A|nr:histidine phosphatase family protein [Thiomicrorhabdus aquaedulcis]
MKKWITLTLFTLFFTFRPAMASDEFKSVVIANAQLIEQVRQGGYVIYMRHGKTDTAQPDQAPINLSDCTTQRPLSQEGLAELKQISTYFKLLALPYEPPLVSPLCRAMRTAEIVFGQPIKVDINLQYTAALTTRQKQPIIKRTLELLSEPVASGTNRILVAHGPNLVEMMKYFPPEGSMVFFRPMGAQGFEYLATITPNDWLDLLKQLGQ